MLPQLQIVETTLKTTRIYSCSTSTRIRRPCCGAEADPYGLTGVMRRFIAMVWRWVIFAAF